MSLDYSTNVWEAKHTNLSKVHITGITAANVVRGKMPMFVIEKARKLRCFKNVKFLACWYRHKKSLDW